jgi:threonine/homoserine/homoserine lactone efflux protein
VNTLFNTVLFLVCVYFLGFLAAIPIGASQIEVARRSLNGFLASALLVVAGSVSSDYVYGAIALYGLAPFLQTPEVQAIFWLVNAALMLIFGIGIFRESKYTGKLLTPRVPKEAVEGVPLTEHPATTAARRKLTSTRLAYITGFSLAFTNPMMIAWWLLAARFLKDLGVTGAMTSTSKALFLLVGGLGIASYLSLFAVVIHRRHKSFSPKGIRRVTRGFGVAMILFSVYFVVRSIMMFTSPSAASGLLGTNLSSNVAHFLLTMHGIWCL